MTTADCEECGFPTLIFNLVMCGACGAMLCDACGFEHDCDAGEDDADFESCEPRRDPDEERALLAAWNQTVKESWPH